VVCRSFKLKIWSNCWRWVVCIIFTCL